jgi:hypothetical protein
MSSSKKSSSALSAAAVESAEEVSVLEAALSSADVSAVSAAAAVADAAGSVSEAAAAAFVSAAADSSDAKPRCGNADSYAAVHSNYVKTDIHSKQYYHIVAVYDVYNHTNTIYVNGCLNNEGNAEYKGLGRTNLVGVNGVLKLPDAAVNQQFYIGGDVEYFSGVPKLQNTWNGGVAMARIYDEALSSEQVALLYAEIEAGLNGLNK